MSNAMRKAKWSTRRVVAGIVIAAMLAILGVGTANVVSGRWQLHPVLSGSMRPGLAVGSVVVTEREPVAALAPREVILTNPPGDPHFEVIHRVISVTPQAGGPVVQTMGDDNTAPDPWKVRVTSPYIYQARFDIPLIGYAALALHSPHGRQATLAFAGFLLLLAGANTARQRRRGGVAPDTAVTAITATSLTTVADEHVSPELAAPAGV